MPRGIPSDDSALRRLWDRIGARVPVKWLTDGNLAAYVQLLFEENTLPIPESGCVIWVGRDHEGYGRLPGGLALRLGTDTAHRASWQVANGQRLTSSQFVCHHCDVPSCVRADHLFVGTIDDNFADMRAKKRHAYGPRHGLSKLTPEVVDEVRAMALAGMSPIEIHDRLRSRTAMTVWAVRDILTGRTWAHLAARR